MNTIGFVVLMSVIYVVFFGIGVAIARSKMYDRALKINSYLQCHK